MEIHGVSDADVLGNNPIYQNGSVVGRATGGDFGFRLNKSIALGMVKPELADLVENYILNLSVQGKLPGQISDDQLKQILSSAQQPKRDFKINRV